MNNFLGPWTILAGVSLAYLVYCSLFNIFAHPLRRFPGPKIAALTWLYSTYYELIKDGGLVEHLERLHKIFGPVVRISPNELHFSDPRAYADIYTSGLKFPKDPKYYRAFADGESSFASSNPHEAKIRRDAVSPFFSRRAIFKLENVVQEKVDLLLSQLLQYKSLSKSANIDAAFHSTSLDIITSYCFGHSAGALAVPNFQHPLISDMKSSLILARYFHHFPITQYVMLRITDSFIGDWVVMGFVAIRRKLSRQIDTILADPASLQSELHETVFHHLITPLPVKDQFQILSKTSLLNEAVNLMIAGSDPVANTCKIGSFYVLNDKTVYTRLVEELDGAWPNKDSKIGLGTLEKLPYLTAVIKECLRMTHGVVNGLPRVVGPNSAEIAGFNVPKGTIVSMGSPFVHYNAEIFPDPFKFSPDRWLQPNSEKLDHYLVAFSKGHRSCFGINLAWCELYLIFANLFRKTEMTIDETTVDDLKFRAYFIPIFRGRPLRVFIEERET